MRIILYRSDVKQLKQNKIMVNHELKVVKRAHKESAKNDDTHMKGRQKLLDRILKSRTPNWGSLIIKVF